MMESMLAVELCALEIINGLPNVNALAMKLAEITITALSLESV